MPIQRTPYSTNFWVKSYFLDLNICIVHCQHDIIFGDKKVNKSNIQTAKLFLMAGLWNTLGLMFPTIFVYKITNNNNYVDPQTQ